ncbi:MAG TPA: LUD domain-containing protein [Anaerolineales bacterium]|nr:LUD domain-containing protein [Anaerolineales bacterium]
MNSNRFRQRIRQSLANEILQIALDANAERRLKGRAAAFASLPDWRERRHQAHILRADVIEHLEDYLQQFISNAQRNGIVVHRASDANEAIEIILEITKSTTQNSQSGESTARKILIAKSKSMVSEEINLNHALERENFRVVETDLGEYIVQLRRERPAHIITPAVHLRRQEVGQLFHEKLGVPYTEDIAELTQIARRILREIFLSADVGISGVNFGIAETGGICIVTNEGNGRMVTTLPPLHIALMGMERLVRNFEDLAILLSLLPRSATGQKLTVYTQIIHKPLPHQQRHLVLLDNGRTRLRNSPLKESLYCIRCGACLNACPVFREIGGHAYNSVYPGPIGSVISAGLFGSEFVPLAQASSLCGACKEACPVEIDLPKLLTRVRAGQSPLPNRQSSKTGLSRFSVFFLRTYSRFARSPRLFALSQTFAWLITRLLSPRSEWIRLPAFTGWGYSKDFPRFAGKTFRARFHQRGGGRGERGELREGGELRKRRELEERGELGEGEVSQPFRDKEKREQFIEELAKLNGHVIRTRANELTDKVIEFLRSRGINRIHLEPNVLNESLLQKAGITFSREAEAALRVGVTKALCGLADTGSVLEADGEGNKLHASLLPEIHIVILHTSDILPSLLDALPRTLGTKSAVFITGPSRTSDIEMSLTIGVHGPGELYVFLVDD